MCLYFGSSYCIRILDFLSDKLVECCSANNGTSIVYRWIVYIQLLMLYNTWRVRPYFRLTTDILLGTGKDYLLDCQNAIKKIITKAYLISTRNGPNDAEFIYSVQKLLFRIGYTLIYYNYNVFNKQYRYIKCEWSDNCHEI